MAGKYVLVRCSGAAAYMKEGDMAKLEQGSVKEVTFKIRTTATNKDVREAVVEWIDDIRSELTVAGHTAIVVKKPTVTDVGKR